MKNAELGAKGVRALIDSLDLPRPVFGSWRHVARAVRCRPATRLATLAVGAALLLSMLVVSTASAHYVRPFLREITGTGSASFGSFSGPEGLAVDAAGNLWVGDSLGLTAPPFRLNEFEPATAGNAFEQTLAIEGLEQPENDHEPWGLTSPESLAINRTDGDFYVLATASQHSLPAYAEIFTSAGGYVGRFGPFPGPSSIAVDNSAEPSAGTVYVAHSALKFDEKGSLAKFAPDGKAESFAASAPYITGNELGAPSPYSFSVVGPVLVAVGPVGEIYSLEGQGHGESQAILEYAPSGLFLKAITAASSGAPRLVQGQSGFGDVVGLATAPNGDVFASVRGESGTVRVDAVVEFDASGRFLGRLTESAPGDLLATSLGGDHALVADSQNDLYVDVKGEGKDPSEHAVAVYGPGVFVPGLSLGEATERTESAAVLNGTINPEALADPEHEQAGFQAVSECFFEYVAESAFKSTEFSDLSTGGRAPCEPHAALIPADESAHHVEVHISENLTPGVTYRYRLAAATGGAKGGAAHTASLEFTVPHAPLIEAGSVENVSSTFADLRATINPLGAATSYRFEYLTQAGFDANGGSFSGPDAPTAAPIPDAQLGAGGPTGSSSEEVLQHVGGLSPATAYVFRVRAENECEAGAQCVSTGPEGVFTTLPAASTGLPDNRAYELLTPPDKGSAEDMFNPSPDSDGEVLNTYSDGVASETGDRFLLETKSAFGSNPGSGGSVYAFSRESGAGWSYRSLASPGLGVQATALSVFDPASLSMIGFGDGIGSGAGEAGVQVASMVGPPGGPYTTLHTDASAHPGESVHSGAESTAIVGASRDLSHLILQSNGRGLCPGAEEEDVGAPLLCEYAGGEPSLVNVKGSGSLLSKCGAVLGDGDGAGGAHGAVSEDGSRVLFISPDPNRVNGGEGCWDGKALNAPQLFTRADGATVEVSAPEAKLRAERGHYPATFVGAAEDGSRVFFLSEAWLTEPHPATHDRELYEYDTETAKLTRVSAGASDNAEGGVFKVPSVSADGSAVYFMANGVLADNRGADGTSPTAGDCAEDLDIGMCALYRYDANTRTTRFVATVNGPVDFPPSPNHAGVRFGLNARVDWYATPDGRYLLFDSWRELTGYDTHAANKGDCLSLDASPTGGHNGHCDELYRYDSATGTLICVSCDPSGALPVSNAGFARSALEQLASGPVRAMSNDGSYVFFDTVDALVPGDTNKALDVYEWHEGRVSLISSGKDPGPSFLLGASADGANVFFGTHARLVAQDTDTQGDVYDARICTASDPCVKPPVGETAQCEGGACQIPPPQPSDATPSSFTFFGAGDLVSEIGPSSRKAVSKKRALHCRKGAVKRKGRCVKRHEKKRKQAKKSAKGRK